VAAAKREPTDCLLLSLSERNSWRVMSFFGIFKSDNFVGKQLTLNQYRVTIVKLLAEGNPIHESILH
jgi:hypothetical protein